MKHSNYQVLLDGKAVGPYDRKTIVGMRVKRALSGDHVLVSNKGDQLTVRELVGRDSPPQSPANAARGASRVRATYRGSIVESDGRGLIRVPPFKGEIEVRIQTDVLRLAGRYRRLLVWKEGRVNIPLAAIVQAKSTGSRVDLWLGGGESAGGQRLALDLLTAENAAELIAWIPNAPAVPAATLPTTPQE